MSGNPGPIEERMTVGVVVERRAIRSKWQDHSWHVVDVLPGAPEAAPWTMLGETGDATRWLAGTADLVLFKGETSNYKYNLEAPEPAVYVVLRRADAPPGMTLLIATVDPGEAHAHADTGDDLVEAVPMPGPVRAWVEAFVATHHVEKGRYKRERDRADPESMGHRGRAARGPRGWSDDE